MSVTVGRAGRTGKVPKTRTVTASQFRDTRHCALLSVEQTAERLGVTPRTIHNWESGRTRVPYAAFRLLRITDCYELPGEDWAGYKLVHGVLWSPEGLAFKPEHQRWWSLTCRMADQFRRMVQRPRAAAEPAHAARAAAAGDRAAPGLVILKTSGTAGRAQSRVKRALRAGRGSRRASR